MSFVVSQADDPLYACIAKITHILIDNYRNCLYTAASSQIISVFYLGSDGAARNITPAATLRDLPRQAQLLVGGAWNLDLKNFDIIGFHVITPSESSSDVHAVIITARGVRLYLTHRKSSFGYGFPSYGTSSSGSQPTDLRVMHVRVPPSNMIDPATVNNKIPPVDSLPFQITKITDTFYSNGLFIASQPPPPVQDGSSSTLVCAFPDTPSIASLKQVQQVQPMFGQHHSAYSRPTLTENIKLLLLPGESWAITELPQSTRFESIPSTVFNEIVTQFSNEQRELVVLSHVGVTPLVKLRPVDILYRLIQHDNRMELELFCRRQVPRYEQFKKLNRLISVMDVIRRVGCFLELWLKTLSYSMTSQNLNTVIALPHVLTSM